MSLLSYWHRNLFENPLVFVERLHGSGNQRQPLALCPRLPSICICESKHCRSPHFYPVNPPTTIHHQPGFCYSLLIVYMLNTLLISSIALCVLSQRKLNCLCLNVSVRSLTLKEKRSCLGFMCNIKYLVDCTPVSGGYTEVYDQNNDQALLCFSWKLTYCICNSVC